MVRPEDAARLLRARNDLEREALRSRMQAAHREALVLARSLLAECPEVGRVWGFGSTFETWRHYRRDSDIDLAVESGDSLSLQKIVERSTFKVDLVVLAELPESMAESIRTQGTLLEGALP